MSHSGTAQIGGRVFLAAFGKHPGWNDHIEDLGVETEALAAFKRMLYVEGVGANIDSGAWAKLSEEQRLPGFGHVFLWRSHGALMLGRMWASRDGKGRALYPMVVCAQCAEKSAPWILRHMPPLFESIEGQAKATTKSQDVVALLDKARDELRSAPDVDGGLPEWFTARQALAELGDDPVAFRRALYRIERDLPGFVESGGKGRRSERLPQVMRVPAGGERRHEMLLVWAGLLLQLLDSGTPLFLASPLGHGWIDIIAGRPGPSQLYCLLVSRQVIPVVTQVPYNLDEAFAARADALAGEWRQNSPDLAGAILRAGGGGADSSGTRVPQWMKKMTSLFGAKGSQSDRRKANGDAATCGGDR